MKKFREDFSHFWELTLEMTKKDIKTRYKNAFLGFLWMILMPILQMIVIGFVFSLFLKVPTTDYFPFLFAGLLPWNFFSISLPSATSSIVANRDLIDKSNFPSMTIPFSIVLSNFFHFLIALFFFLIVLVVLGKTSINLLFLPIILLWQLFLISGFSTLVSSLYVFYRDILYLVQAFLILIFYALPIIYPLTIIPKNYLPLFYLNPLTGLISSYRMSLLGENILPFWLLTIHFIFAILIFILGFWVFRRKSPWFTDWL
jgi:lipopolysaccharide transport system permease protein